eukprot:comp20108_c0_seq1/m.24801 comp20108_c0_seq1/g.24801  ORF comp20108_c0_seq1/g.24801 comp20108_c0_seq1/m.24801 type:complete len:587 (-) comp20108_c0_seq1:589-2349(-)
MVFSELLVFRDLARAELMSLLAEVPGKKDVVVDPAVLSALEFAIPQDFILGQAVEGIFPLAEDQPTADSLVQVYVARPLPKMARMIADRVRTAKDKQHFVIFIPRRAPVCEKVFEQEGIYSAITVRELNLSLLCLDDDLLSLEFPQFYKTFYLKGVMSRLYQAAQTVVALNSVYGIIPTVHGRGRAARAVYEMSYRMMRDCGDDLQKSVNPDGRIRTLVVLDRQVDLLAPCLQPTTYAALIDEFYHLNLGSAVLDFGDDSGNRTVFTASSSDEIFAEIRSKSLSHAAQTLHDKVCAALSQPVTPKHSLSSIKRMAENLDPVKYAKLKMHVRLLDRLWQHTHHIEYKEMIEFQKGMISGEVWTRRQSTGTGRSSTKSGREGKEDDKALAYLENCMCRRMPALNALRLLCLYSLTRGGIPDARWNDIRGMFIKTYGFEHLHTLHRLETLGMLRQESSGAQPVRHIKPLLCASLEHILSKDTWAQAPGDAQVEDGEVFTEHHTLGNFASNAVDTTNCMPTPTVQTILTCASPRDGPEKNSEVAVMVVGGITREEVAAMRTLAAESSRQLIICATNVISGDSFFSELCVD